MGGATSWGNGDQLGNGSWRRVFEERRLQYPAADFSFFEYVGRLRGILEANRHLRMTRGLGEGANSFKAWTIHEWCQFERRKAEQMGTQVPDAVLRGLRRVADIC